jgi:acyl-lipid omega-3 desaturase
MATKFFEKVICPIHAGRTIYNHEILPVGTTHAIREIGQCGGSADRSMHPERTWNERWTHNYGTMMKLFGVVVFVIAGVCPVQAFSPRLVDHGISLPTLTSKTRNVKLMVAQELTLDVTAPTSESKGVPVAACSLIDQRNLNDDIPPSLGSIRKLLPPGVFQVDTPTSLLYFVLDLVAVLLSMGSLNAIVTSDFYHALPLFAQASTVLPIQMVTGFAMWCMWCIGHDAGHTTISKDRTYGKLINRVVGEISHSIICLTPFVPWQKSHLQHHLNHNHLERDYSHQWFIREDASNLHPLIQLSYQTRNLQLPILYLVYLLFGVPDGGHVYFYGRLWEEESRKEKIKASVSVALSIITATTLWMNMGTADFAVVCMVPWLILSMWLFTVTYLQHHSEDGRLYTDDTWTFTKGAFQTVDRNYGKYINQLSHHMMDGHVIHHLFFTRVPHYHLKEATDALQKGMQDQGLSHWYKKIDTLDFGLEIVKQFDENWFFCNDSQVVRK